MIFSRTLVAVLSATAILGITGKAAAFNPQPEPPGSVAIGLISDQFARITFTNSTDRVSGILPCVCPIDLIMLDESGEAVARRAMEVSPGAVGSFEVDLGLRGGERRLVRALVELTGSEGARLACHIGSHAAFEIVDASDGATTVTVPIVTTYLSPASTTLQLRFSE